MNTRKNAIVIGRLLLIGLLLVIRWILWLPYSVLLIFYTVFESGINGATYVIAYFKQLNNEQLSEKAK
jgi:hypothetical protein